MNSDYIITNEELSQRGLDLNDYALTGTHIPAIIQLGLDICVTRCCFLNDNFQNGEDSVESALDSNTSLVNAFKKLQYRVIFNLIFMGQADPVNNYVDSIIVHELGWGKINGFQKGLHYKNN